MSTFVVLMGATLQQSNIAPTVFGKTNVVPENRSFV